LEVRADTNTVDSLFSNRLLFAAGDGINASPQMCTDKILQLHHRFKSTERTHFSEFTMTLVAYSDSESSDTEDQRKTTVRATTKPAQSQTAAGFALDKSNPRKIQVSLATSAPSSQRAEDGEPAPKRAKLGGGGAGGFNAMLPAPKKENEKKVATDVTTRKVFSLKTGSEPGFSRAADAELRQLFTEQTAATSITGTSQSTSKDEDNSEPLSVGNPMRFRPLSVVRNTRKRSAISFQSKKAAPGGQKDSLATPSVASVPVPKPKVSLFSARLDATPVIPERNRYYEADEATSQQEEESEEAPAMSLDSHDDHAAPTQPQSLDTIASDLNLSAADRRRLFGREGKGLSSAIKIVNFNTDQEYAANEALRASGEQVQHHAVRGIAPGKHSLKQLVNAAATQKDALEESFAAGKSNKREAGSRYGW
jgi:hypothetical protein